MFNVDQNKINKFHTQKLFSNSFPWVALVEGVVEAEETVPGDRCVGLDAPVCKCGHTDFLVLHFSETGRTFCSSN